MISIPSEFEVVEGTEYYLTKDQNDTITFVPIIEDYFSDAEAGEFHEPMEWDDVYKPQGREWNI